MNSPVSKPIQIPTSAEQEATRERLLKQVNRNGLTVALVPAVVAAYLIGLILDLKEADFGPLFYATLLGIIVFFGFLGPALFTRLDLRWALAFHPGDAPGDRLKRLLTAPTRNHVRSGLLNWVAGATVFTTVIAIGYGKPWTVVPLGTLVGISHWMMTSILTIGRFQNALQDEATAEFHRHSGARVGERTLMWPRNAWYLPYAFVALLATVLIDMGVLVGVKLSTLSTEAMAEMEAQGNPAAARQLRELAGRITGEVVLAVAVIAVLLIGMYVASALLLARREQRATTAIAESLAALAAENPKLPDWIATDETGDLAMHTAQISADMRVVFDRLRAMSQGDVSVELEGQSQLVTAFRESQLTLIRLTDRLLKTGTLGDRQDIPGELGRNFAHLASALEAIVQQSSTIAAGDLRSEVELDGALGSAIGKMTANLRAMVGRTQDFGRQIADIVVTLRSAATQLSAATTQQVAALTETANTMTEMAQTSAVSAERASELIRRGEDARTAMEAGRTRSREATEAMGAIREALSRVAAESSSLAERVQRVDAIIETVGFFADQSSTLAINAGIEAARAGDSGRAFAAVAREMRALAAESRKATQQIQEILGDVRSRTVQVDRTVGAGTATVERGGALVQQFDHSIEQLWVTIQDAVGLMRQVEAAARQHEAGVNQVSQALTSMQGASESIRDGARTLSGMSEQAQTLSEALKETAGAYQLPARG